MHQFCGIELAVAGVMLFAGTPEPGKSAEVLAPGDIAFVGISMDSPDRFAWVAMREIAPGTCIYFTDEAWTGSGFRGTTEETGVWTAPGNGVAGGAVIRIEGATVTGGGTWSGDILDGLSASSGDQILAFQVSNGSTNFLAGIGAGSDRGNWIDSGIADANHSYIPAELEQGISLFGFTEDNGYFYPCKRTGSRWGYLGAINNSAGWFRSSDPVTFPDWSFSIGDTPCLSVGDIAFIAYQTSDPDRFAFVALTNLCEGSELIFTDMSCDGVFPVLALGEDVGVWTAPVNGISAGTVIRVQGTNVTGGGTMSGALSNLSPAGDQIFACQGYMTHASFIAGLCTKNWSVIGEVSKINSYVPGSLTNGVSAVSWTAAGELDNGYYAGPLKAISTARLLLLINNSGNWMRNDNTQSWPVPWNFRTVFQCKTGTLFKFR